MILYPGQGLGGNASWQLGLGWWPEPEIVVEEWEDVIIKGIDAVTGRVLYVIGKMRKRE